MCEFIYLFSIELDGMRGEEETTLIEFSQSTMHHHGAGLLFALRLIGEPVLTVKLNINIAKTCPSRCFPTGGTDPLFLT